jgi:hypothetical protein
VRVDALYVNLLAFSISSVQSMRSFISFKRVG